MTEAVATPMPTAEHISASGLPGWLQARKLTDLEVFEQLPMPSSGMEDWRRTDVSDLDLARLTLPGARASSIAARDAERSGPNGHEREGATLLQRGAETWLTASEELSRQGVLVIPLEEAAAQHPELVQRYLEHEVVPAAAGKFAAYNAAFWRGGAFVYVPRGVEAAAPVWCRVATAPAAGGPEAILPRSLVVLEDGASLIFSEEYVDGGETSGAVSSAITEIVLGDGARIQYLVLQQWPHNVDHFATHRVHLGRDCHAELVIAATGAGRSKTYMEVALHGSGSTARISGLVLGDGRQHFDYQSLQDHFAPNCTSDLLVKGALRDEAVSIYSGLIKIRKDAQHSDAYQANRNLLLSDKAKADTMPKLEIEANDVRCTHGATVGQVDQEQLFYLRSRGVPLREAQNVLIHGFFQPVIDRIALPQVRDEIHDAIDHELSGLDPAAIPTSPGHGAGPAATAASVAAAETAGA